MPFKHLVLVITKILRKNNFYTDWSKEDQNPSRSETHLNYQRTTMFYFQKDELPLNRVLVYGEQNKTKHNLY